MIFTDTPGWLKPSDPFQSFMKRSIVQSLYDDADVILWVINPDPLKPEELEFGQLLARTNKPLVIVVNKADKVHQEKLLERVHSNLDPVMGKPTPLFATSAKNGVGIDPLKKGLIDLLPFSPPYFPTDQITDRWERFYVTEIIRERLFYLYQDEIPHACAVVLEDFVEKDGRKDHIQAQLFVETEGQKKIVIGQGGKLIKKLGQSARLEIEEKLGRPVYLELYVKVKKNWRKDPVFIKELYERDK